MEKHNKSRCYTSLLAGTPHQSVSPEEVKNPQVLQIQLLLTLPFWKHLTKTPKVGVPYVCHTISSLKHSLSFLLTSKLQLTVSRAATICQLIDGKLIGNNFGYRVIHSF